MPRLLASGIGWIVLLCAADTAGANWTEPSGGSLNADTTLAADSTSTATVGGVPYVAWNEDGGTQYQIRVRRLEGAAWMPVGAYRLRVVARNSAGAGKPATRRFRIKKR